MNDYQGHERRKYERYETDLKIQFHVTFDVVTKIDFRIKKNDDSKYSSQVYSAISRNVSVEGLCFYSKVKLHQGDCLYIELYVPSAKDPIVLEGEVRWATKSRIRENDDVLYDTGVKLSKINGQDVQESIFVDEVNHIVWSAVLEAVFTSFKHLAKKRTKGEGSL